MQKKVFKDECCFTFDTPESPNGLYICLKHFIGIGSSILPTYRKITGSHLFLQYKISKIFKKSLNEAPVTHSKLAIGVDGGFELPTDKYVLIQTWKLVSLDPDSHTDVPNPPEKPNPNDLSYLSSFPQTIAKAIAHVQLSQSAILLEEREQAAAMWEASNSRPVSVHADKLVQLENPVKIRPLGWKCCQCDMKDNLWLNLTDGSILCGRKFWDGSGGNNHAAEHFDKTNYPLVVKLGTITTDSAEVYSYAEDSMVTDPKLIQHLAHFGIEASKMQKTDKTLLELEISANERLGEWFLLQESNTKLEPRWGPGLTGLHNLGNSCYLNAVMQTLFALESFKTNFSLRLNELAYASMERMPHSPPFDDFLLQLSKLGDGLASGNHSWCAETQEELEAAQKKGGEVPRFPGIRPSLFRRVVGLNHPEFRSKRLQDAHEFMEHVFSLLQEMKMTRVLEESLQFTIEEKLKCGSTGKVRYTQHRSNTLTFQIPLDKALNKAELAKWQAEEQHLKTTKPEEIVRPIVPLKTCLLNWSCEEMITDWTSPATGEKTFALRSQRLVTFPDYLILHAARFKLGENWEPLKLDVELSLVDSLDMVDSVEALNSFGLDLSDLKSCGGLLPGEESLPDSDEANNTTFEPRADIISQLMEMGFSHEASVKACKHTDNAGMEQAMEWVFSHADDPTLNEPEPEKNTVKANSESVQMLMSLGLTTFQAEQVLGKFNQNLELAADWVLNNPEQAQNLKPENEEQTEGKLSDGKPIYQIIGLISHMGKNTNEGHYVCHLKRSELQPNLDPRTSEWIIFNDDKVAKSEKPPFQFAYLYILRRV
ncbi:Ubiquitin carboxyl-terminal hydrolase 13 [Cichlidogyrus casuarinus]|uniref:Ubiquitin carboxyl-terminal hydrolase n=1 Tax=Cichlidogyrus casuarinus TaxID=1844966 RepID=A0ABD2QJI0_9PLAT